MVPPSAGAPAAPPAAPAPRARVAAEPGGDGVAAPASAPAPVPRLELRSAVLERFGAGGAGAGNGRAAPAPGGAAASPGDLCDPGGGGGGGGGASVQALGERGRSQTLPAAAAVGAGLAEGLEDVGRSLTLPGAGRGREAAPAAVTVTAQRMKTWPLNLGRGARLPFAPRPQAASSTGVPGQGAAALTRSATRAQTPKRRAGRRC